jgi:hypothetical protein
MYLIVFSSSAYDAGQHVGTIVRWIALAVAALRLVAYLRAGRFGSGMRSQRVAVGALSVIAVLIIASAVHDFGGRDKTDAAVTAWGNQLVAGCVAAGSPQSVCDCVWDEIRSAGYDTRPELARLEAATRVPPVIDRAMQTCVGRFRATTG